MDAVPEALKMKAVGTFPCMTLEQELNFKQLWDLWISAACVLAGILHLFLHVPYLHVERDPLNFLHSNLMEKYSKIYSPNRPWAFQTELLITLKNLLLMCYYILRQTSSADFHRHEL